MSNENSFYQDQKQYQNYQFPPPVNVSIDDLFSDYFLKRARQHIHDSYIGVPMLKTPESLRIYEHLLWTSGANIVIELGCLYGGSTLWFRDKLLTYSHYKQNKNFRIIAVDLDISAAANNIKKVSFDSSDIFLVEGDLREPSVVNKVSQLVPEGSRCLVIEDSAHTYEVTHAALSNFSHLVPLNSFFIVEDGHIDGPLRSQFSESELQYNGIKFGGITKAIQDWSSTGDGLHFTVRSELELYGLSMMPGGILQRTSQL